MPHERIEPRLLLTPRRLDLAIKWRFFRHLIEGSDEDSRRVYRWHIQQRTGGKEARSWKVCVEDYVSAARELLASMQLRGFDPECPVRFGSNGLLMEGAHRIACALALGECVWIETLGRPGNSSPWDEEWLRKDGVSEADLARVLSDFAGLTNEARDHPDARVLRAPA